MTPGEVLPADGSLTLNADRPSIELEVENTGDRPIQVGSHYHFFEANAALRFEPGERRRVSLVRLAGERRVYGLRGLVNGPLG